MCTKKYITFFQRYPLPAPPLTLTFKRKITSAEVSTLFQNCLFLSFLFCKMKSRKYIETEREPSTYLYELYFSHLALKESFFQNAKI